MPLSYGLTPLQETMLATSCLTHQPWLYVEQIVVHMSSECLEGDTLNRAMTALFKAHPALSNVAVMDDGHRPRQKQVPGTVVQADVRDWRALDAAQVDDGLQQFLRQDRDKGVDATSAPAFRVTLFQTGATQSILVWTFPHSLLDGRAFAPLLDEMFTLYAGFSNGQATAAAPPETAFKAHCQRLDGLSHAEGEAHFAKTLKGWEGTEGLLREGAAATRKTECLLDLTEAETTALTTSAARVGVPVSTLVLAAWGIVLARVSGQADVVFGNTRNGRHLVEGSASAAGCFINTVPIRLRLNPTLTLGAVLKNLRAEQVAVRPHEHTPLTGIRRRLGLPLGRNIFDSVVMFDQGTLDQQLKQLSPQWQRRRVELLEEGEMPVSVAAYMGPCLRVVVEYDPSQVPLGAQLGACLRQFLIAVGTAQPQTPLAAISMLDATDTAQVLHLAGPQMAPAETIETCLDRFEHRAAQMPDSTAVIEADGPSLTFGALDQAADELARKLVGTGIKPGDLIGICMGRSTNFITAILAIWKAGAGFVPMDPRYPVDTLNAIAQDSAARLVLTDHTAPDLAATTCTLEEVHGDGALPSSGRSAEDVAYVIFTSGSTGRPKGVMITHRSFGAHCEAIIPTYGLNAQDRVLQFAALSFDVALEEIIPTLVSGATLVLRNDAMATSVSTFLEQVQSLDITVTNLPTGFWIALTEVLDSSDLTFPPSVRLVIVGGERVPLSILKRWRKRLPEVRWMNGYGPTETTITCTLHEITPKDLMGSTVPIGTPLSHARGWVLSADGALVPPEIEGELFISGHAVAKGYVNAPDQTAKSFVTAGFDKGVGRIYATGDRVAWRDGALHFLGRTDKQLKLRGFRIEPGQIEAALEALPNIDRAVADLIKPKSGPPQLVAWYAAPDGIDLPDAKDIKDTLARRLPPQMQPIPIGVTDWPYTPGGKLDVARLPHPVLDRASNAEDMQGVNSELVQQVATLFAKVLGLEQVGPATSFYDAGGDSLSLLRLMPELEAAFDVRLDPSALYFDPSPRGVVRVLQDRENDPLVMIPIQPNGTRPPLYGVHVLGDNGSFFRPLAQVLGPDQPVLGVTVGLLSKDTPTSVEGIAEFYRKQIERYQPDGPLSLIAVSAGSYVTLELAHQLLAAGRDVQALILLDAEGPDGRARVGRLGRLKGHLSLLMEQGLPYIQKQRALRKAFQAQDAARQRLESQAAKEKIAPDDFNVDEFVAANMLAIEAYQPRPYPRQLTIFRAGGDRFDSKHALETGLGWASVAQAGFDMSDVPGDHLGILEPPNVQTLGRKVAARLKATRPSPPDGAVRG